MRTSLRIVLALCVAVATDISPAHADPLSQPDTPARADPLSQIDRPVRAEPHALGVHEWGTFTSLQDEAGRAIGGINTDDEPVPAFVHRLSNFPLLRPTEAPPIFFQGAPACHPHVTLRLETPVLYFHLPAGRPVRDVDVTAQFRGGWLTEFYPRADASAPGVRRDSAAFGPLRADTLGSLTWRSLEVGGNWSGPATTEHVWTAPRAVDAAAVRAGNEAERFLFYRGVGHIDAPLAVQRDATKGGLTVTSQLPPALAGPLDVRALWLADVSASGAVAFRELAPVPLPGSGGMVARTPATFASDDYETANAERLRRSLHAALRADGLFDDEARALLDTWRLSYFRSTGQRLLFIVPRAWTDHYLPLTISVDALVTRVMVGRIELVRPEQREHLRQLAAFTPKRIADDAELLRSSYYARLREPAGTGAAATRDSPGLSARGVDVPGSYRHYLALGRFRNALLLDEARGSPSPALAQFVSAYALQGYTIAP